MNENNPYEMPNKKSKKKLIDIKNFMKPKDDKDRKSSIKSFEDFSKEGK